MGRANNGSALKAGCVPTDWDSIPSTVTRGEYGGASSPPDPTESVTSAGRTVINATSDRPKLNPDTGDPPHWKESANCLGVDPDLFFPERGASTREAKEICKGCVSRPNCLEYALDNGEKFGIWGGMSERERRRLRRQRALARRAADEQVLIPSESDE